MLPELHRDQSLQRSSVPEVPFVTVSSEVDTNRSLSQLIGREITSVRLVHNCNGAKLIDGTEHFGSAFLLEVEDGILKLALVPVGGGFKFVLYHEDPIVFPAGI